jgi:hypothetical protein
MWTAICGRVSGQSVVELAGSLSSSQFKLAVHARIHWQSVSESVGCLCPSQLAVCVRVSWWSVVELVGSLCLSQSKVATPIRVT